MMVLEVEGLTSYRCACDGCGFQGDASSSTTVASEGFTQRQPGEYFCPTCADNPQGLQDRITQGIADLQNVNPNLDMSPGSTARGILEAVVSNPSAMGLFRPMPVRERTDLLPSWCLPGRLVRRLTDGETLRVYSIAAGDVTLKTNDHAMNCVVFRMGSSMHFAAVYEPVEPKTRWEQLLGEED